MNRGNHLLNMFNAMLAAMGPSHWWPGDTPFEVAVGALLTQNTNWGNVARAIANLKASGEFTAEGLAAMPEARLAELIRPAGYFRVKAVRLKNFLAFLGRECGYAIETLAGGDMEAVREKLLGVKGIGPETADSILLYALNYPSFVVDAYTARIFSRHGLVPEEVSYAELREFFVEGLDPDVKLFNEFHALLVRVGKEWCRPKAGRCALCPLSPFLP